MKRVICLLVCMLLAALTVYGQTSSYKDALKIAAASAAGNTERGEIAAVVDFRSSSPQFSQRVTGDLTALLLENGVRVVERRNIEPVLREQEFQYSGDVDENSMVSLGHLLGADSIITGSGENMADYYRMNFTMLSVETAEVLMRLSVNVRYDAAMTRLLSGRAAAAEIGSTHFMAGLRLGAGFEINTADEDMTGEGYSPKEKSNTAFNVTLCGAFRFNPAWSIQPEINLMLNNGMEISGQGTTITIAYPTLDIPLLVRWNFIRAPLVAGIVLGPYISIPIGKLNLSFDDQGAALDTGGYTFGIAGGFALGLKAGPGHISADVRYINDFNALYVREDFGYGVEDANICVRRSVNLTIGYEFSL